MSKIKINLIPTKKRERENRKREEKNIEKLMLFIRRIIFVSSNKKEI